MTEFNRHQLPRFIGDIEKLNDGFKRLHKTQVITLSEGHWLFYNDKIGLNHVKVVDWTQSIGGIRETFWLSQSVISGGSAYILRRSYTPHHTPGQTVELHDWKTLELIWNIQQIRHTTGYGSHELVDWPEHTPAAVWSSEDWGDLTPDLLKFFRGDAP